MLPARHSSMLSTLACMLEPNPGTRSLGYKHRPVMSDTDYSEEEGVGEVEPAMPALPRSNVLPASSTSGGPGSVVGLGIAAAVALAGAVGYFVLSRGKGKQGAARSSS